MKTFFIATLLGINLLTSTSQAGNPEKSNSNTAKSGTVITLTNETFKTAVFNYEKNSEWKYEGDLPAIIDFYADWCGPCRQLSPRLAEIAKEFEGKIVVYKVDTEVEKILSQNLGITSLPTLLFIPAKGKPQVSMGALPKETLVKAVNEVLLVK
jgi:thioredoxin